MTFKNRTKKYIKMSNKIGIKKKGRKSNQELQEAKHQIEQMITTISEETKNNLDKYNFNLLTNQIQMLQK